MTEFSPVSALFGGALIGLSAVLLLWLNGRIAGISGILSGGLASGADRGWKLLFIAGLLLGAGVVVVSMPELAERAIRQDFPLGLVVIAGVLVGFGSRLGSGCTSGHGVCGVARLSPRSLVAVAVFMLAGAVTVFAVRHLLGVLP